MLKCSKLFIELYGTVDDLNSLRSRNARNELVSLLSHQYPNVTIPITFKNELDLNCSLPTKPSSVIFRRLVGNLIPNHIDWALRNGKSMLHDFNEELSASFGNFLFFIKSRS